MAGTTFQVKTYGATIISRKLSRCADRAENLRPAWPAIKERAAEGFENSFGKQGPGWAPLKPATVRSRIAQGYGGTSPILQRTGRLKDAYTIDLHYRGDASTIEFVIDVDYGKYHFNGPQNMVARKVLLSRCYDRSLSEIIGRIIINAYNLG